MESKTKYSIPRQYSYFSAEDFEVCISASPYPTSIDESKYVFISLMDLDGLSTEEVALETSEICQLNNQFKFVVRRPEGFGKVGKLRLHLSFQLDGEQWFVGLITVGPLTSLISSEVNDIDMVHFPLRRWIKSGRRYNFVTYDAVLPQHDDNAEQRKRELKEQSSAYKSKPMHAGGPLVLETIPTEDDIDYIPQRDELLKIKSRLKRLAFATNIFTTKFKSLDDFNKLYKLGFPVPEVISYWRSDVWFGKMRLQGANPTLLNLCNNIPAKFAVNENDVLPSLEGMSMDDALAKDRIFLVDMAMLAEAQSSGLKMWSPMALFYLNKENLLKPIAIQLYQQPGNDNPVYLPTDDPNVWLLAKIYYNSAEAVHHECITHLGGVHVLLDSVWSTTRRELSSSHPIFKLLAPHFYRILGNNHYGINALFREGGIMDAILQGKSSLAKFFLRKEVSYTEINPVLDFAARKVDNPAVLPNYYYRDDSLSFYNELRTYVCDIVTRYYDIPKKLSEDYEIQNWRKALGRDQDQNGCGFTNLPGSDEDGLRNTSELVDIVTTIISTSAIRHAAVNYSQYEQFAFPPNAPLSMRKLPPTSKEPISESYILECLPKKMTMLMSMVFLSILSYLDGNPLGDYDCQYLYHPKDVATTERFKQRLQNLTADIQSRNEKRFPKYNWLLLDYVRNSANI